MSGAIGNPEQGAPGGMWNVSSTGVASPQAGRPALTGGLQQMNMLNAYRGGVPMSQIQAANPYTPRPTQFLPTAMPTYDYMGQYRAEQQAAADRANAALAAAQNRVLQNYGGGGPGGGDGSPGSASSDGGADGSAGAGGGAGGGGK